MQQERLYSFKNWHRKAVYTSSNNVFVMPAVRVLDGAMKDKKYRKAIRQ